MSSNILARGAEAVLIREGNFIIKDRIKKSYRLPALDEKLRKSRTKKEAKLLEKVSKIINVPKVLSTDNKEKIEMQFIEGKKLSDWLDKLPEAEKICEEIGKNTAKLHDADIIHGDLTTSNMILVENSENSTTNNNKNYNKESLHKKSDLLINKENININDNTNNKITQNKRARGAYEETILSEAKPSIHRASGANEASENNFKVFFIDFGLGFNSKRIEDKAVDLHLLRQALEAKHFSNWQNLFSAVLRGYNSKDKAKILEQLKKVESRGRYKKGF